jgi:MFS family permease
VDERPDVTPPHEPSVWRARLRSVAIDISPLRDHPDFRRLWFATTFSSTGAHITGVAIAFQIYELTGSPLAVGLIGLVELIPLFTLSFVGGALADSMDRRKLLMITESVGVACAGGLALNSVLSEPQVWLIYVITAAYASVYALGSPAQRSATPLLVPQESITAAAAVNSMYHNFSAIIGPSIGGVLIAVIGLEGAYAVDVASFLLAIAFIARVKPMARSGDSERLQLRTIFDGIRFLKGRAVLQGSFIVDLNAMIFGMPEALFPAFADALGGGPGVLGLMYAAPSAGALIASLTSGWTSKIRRQGVVVYLAVIGWGASLAIFGLSKTLWLSLVMLAFAGAADMISGIFRTAILQTAAPPEMLGRLHGLELAVVASGPSLGNLEAGALASFSSVRFSTVFGGFACIVGVGVMSMLLPQFARYDASDPSP